MRILIPDVRHHRFLSDGPDLTSQTGFEGVPLLRKSLDQVVIETDSGDRVVDSIEFVSEPQLLSNVCIPLTWL